MKKKRLKLKTEVYYYLAILIILIIGASWGIKKYQQHQYQKTNEYKLTEAGYSLENSQMLIKELTDQDISYILAKPMDDDILNLMKEKYFLKENFQEYYEYHLANKKIALTDVVAIINCHIDNEYYSLNLKTDMTKNYAILVNKYYQMPKDYIPKDLVSVKMDYAWGEYGSIKVRQIVMDKFLDMWNAAQAEGIYLMISSAFRSYAEQEIVYNNYKENQGEAYANKIAAKPGYSEHQTGLAIDIFSKTNTNRNTFQDSDAAKW